MAKILLVEDEKDHIQIIELILEIGGHESLVAESAEDGIKLAQDEKPDLIIMDMLLPGITGLEAIRELKKSPDTSNIPVIALTAIGKSDVEKACREAGVCEFISKPYEKKDLLEKIAKNIK